MDFSLIWSFDLKCVLQLEFSEIDSLLAVPFPAWVHAQSLSSFFFHNSMDGSMPASSVHGVLQATPWGLDCHFLFWGIFLTQGWNLHLLHLLYWQANSLPLSQPWKPPFPTWHSFYIPPVKSWDKITFLFALVSVFKELLGAYRCIVLKLHASYTKIFSARKRADH